MSDFPTRPHPCPICRERPVAGAGSLVDDPLLTTPFARLCAVATDVEIQIVDRFDGLAAANLAGAVAGHLDRHGEVQLKVWVDDALPDDLRTDILAFGIAAVADPDYPFVATETQRFGIKRRRLPAASNGPGHVAWHIAALCGRYSPSATFALVRLR